MCFLTRIDQIESWPEQTRLLRLIYTNFIIIYIKPTIAWHWILILPVSGKIWNFLSSQSSRDSPGLVLSWGWPCPSSEFHFYSDTSFCEICPVRILWTESWYFNSQQITSPAPTQTSTVFLISVTLIRSTNWLQSSLLILVPLSDDILMMVSTGLARADPANTALHKKHIRPGQNIIHQSLLYIRYRLQTARRQKK